LLLYQFQDISGVLSSGDAGFQGFRSTSTSGYCISTCQMIVIAIGYEKVWLLGDLVSQTAARALPPDPSGDYRHQTV